MKIEKLRNLIRALPEGREKTIIIKRYGLDGKFPMSQREIAARLGISRSYVSRIEKKVIEDLRKNFDD